MSRGDPTTFFTRPISVLTALAVLVVVFLPTVTVKREAVSHDED